MAGHGVTPDASAPGAPRGEGLVAKIVFRVTERLQTALVLVVGIGMALWLRLSLLGFKSHDYRTALSPWLDFMRDNGGLHAFSIQFSNYSPAYLYVLLLSLTLFPGLPKVAIIKIPSVFFDLLLAYYVYKIVRIKYGASRLSLVSFLLVLFLPTVVLNSAYWGQADAVYTVCLVACLYYLMTKRELPAFIAFGLAFAVKSQAVFLAPLLLILLLRKRVSLLSFFIIPGIYVLSILPALFVGRPLVELLTLYATQGGWYHSLSRSAPTLYAWFSDSMYDVVYPVGMLSAAVLIIVFCLAVHRSRLKITAGTFVQLATISVVMVPFLLPKMHERYFYPADIFSVLYAFYYPAYFFIPIMVISTSLFSYFLFLFGVEPVPIMYLAVVQFLTLLILLWHLRLTARESERVGPSREAQPGSSVG